MKTNLGSVRKASGMTQAQAAKAANVSLSTLRKWEQGVNEPDVSVIMKFADLYGVTTDTILGSNYADPIDGMRHIRVRPAMRRIPVLGAIAAGDPREAIEQSDESWWLIDPSMQDEDGLFYLRVSGDSMNMVFPDGSLVLVKTTNELRSGDVGVVRVNGDDATVKRVYFAGDTVVLHPESSNPEHHDRCIDRTNPDSPEFRIIGKVVGYTSPGGWRA